MELFIPAPHRAYLLKDKECNKCDLGEHLADSHAYIHGHSNTFIVFDSPLIYSQQHGFAAMRLAYEYTRGPPTSMVFPEGVDRMECTEPCIHMDFRKTEDPRMESNVEIDNTIFPFLTLPREIRNDIYIRVLETSREHWAVMTASVPATKYGPSTRNLMKVKYSFRSEQLQLLCHQIRAEVLEVCQLHAQDICLRELDVGDFKEVLDIFKRQEIMRCSARHISLVYSTPILPRWVGGRGRSIDRCSFLTQVVEPFQSLLKLCPNVESIFVSFVADDPSGPRSQYVPFRDRKEIIKIQVDYRWYQVAEWESVLRQYFSILRKGIAEDTENRVTWEYFCDCSAYANIGIVVSEEEKIRAKLGARQINATVTERENTEEWVDENILNNGEENLDSDEDDSDEGNSDAFDGEEESHEEEETHEGEQEVSNE